MKKQPKPKTQPKKKTGRKLIPIDPKVVEGMALVGATNVEIADFLNVGQDVIRRRFADILTKSRAAMKTRLRQTQFRLANEGNAALCIWLGKQYLGQTDKQELAGKDGAPIKVLVEYVNKANGNPN